MWPFSSKKRDIGRGAFREMQETVDRLEIATRRQKVAHDALAADVEQLSERLNGQLGRILGGGAGRPPKARQGAPAGQLELGDIPTGDKAALRQYFARNPPAEPTRSASE